MFSYRKLSIKHKLRIITMSVVAVALLLSCAAFASYDVVECRRSLRTDLQTLAEIVGSNSTAALSFGDRTAAEELLSGLQANRHLRTARIYSAEGKLFASYRHAGLPPDLRALPPEPESSRFRTDLFVLFHCIKLEGHQIGTLYLESDLDEIHQRLQHFVQIVVFVLLVGSLAALLLTSSLQGIISKPILHLAHTAKRVSVEKDYGIRAVRENDDELGDLVDCFNDMLRQIEGHRGHLEEEVPPAPLSCAPQRRRRKPPAGPRANSSPT